MQRHTLSAALAAAVLCVSGAALAQQTQPTQSPPTSTQTVATRSGTLPPGALGESAIRAAITKAGYSHIRKLKIDDGLWEAKAVDSHGQRVDLRIGPMNGKIYPENGVSKLTPADIKSRLDEEGYTNVHDIQFDDGMWEADATDAQRRRVDLLLDPDTGSVVGAELD